MLILLGIFKANKHKNILQYTVIVQNTEVIRYRQMVHTRKLTQ